MDDARIFHEGDRLGVDFRRARREGVLREVKQAVVAAWTYRTLGGGESPVARRALRRYKAIVEEIGYDPIPN